MWLPLIKAITTHSIRSKSRMCCYFYSLSKILLTYCMYIIVNKATFTVNDTIKAIIKNNIKLINTTSLSHSRNYVVKWQHISTISFPMLSTIQHIFLKINEHSKILQNISNMRFYIVLYKNQLILSYFVSSFNPTTYHITTKIYKTTNYTISYIYLFKIENMVK